MCTLKSQCVTFQPARSLKKLNDTKIILALTFPKTPPEKNSRWTQVHLKPVKLCICKNRPLGGATSMLSLGECRTDCRHSAHPHFCFYPLYPYHLRSSCHVSPFVFISCSVVLLQVVLGSRKCPPHNSQRCGRLAITHILIWVHKTQHIKIKTPKTNIHPRKSAQRKKQK